MEEDFYSEFELCVSVKKLLFYPETVPRLNEKWDLDRIKTSWIRHTDGSMEKFCFIFRINITDRECLNIKWHCYP